MRVPKPDPPSRIRDAYSRRILGNLRGLDPQKVFESGPRDLARAIRGLTPSQLRRRPAPGKWPIAHLVHHICDAELGLAFRIRQALSESGRPFQVFDQDRWADGLNYGRRSVAQSLALYTILRRSHLELLRLMTRADLKKNGIHPERGRENVARIIHLLAGHDLNHLRQIRAIRAGFSAKGRR